MKKRRNARKTPDRLRTKRKIDKNNVQRQRFAEQQRLAEQQIASQTTSVRNKLSIAGIVLLLGSVGASMLLADESKSSESEVTIASTTSSPPKKEHVKESLEVRTQKLIEKAETGFENFGRKVKPLIEANIHDPQLKAELLKPFVLLSANKPNPFKNAEVFLNKFGGNVDDAPVYYFIYGSLDHHEKRILAQVYATYQPCKRAIFLRENFDSNNPVSLLFLYHELTHAADGINLITRQPAQYSEFCKNPGGAVINWEVKAYAFVVEIMNLITNGEVKRIAIGEEEADNSQNVYKICNIMGFEAGQDKDTQLVTNLLQLAQAYYPEGVVDGLVPKAFLKELLTYMPVVKDCNRTGSCHNITVDGNIMPIRRGHVDDHEVISRRIY